MTTRQFQLFPPPPPKNKSTNSPFRRSSKKETARDRSPSPVQLEDLKSSAKAESVVVQVIEDTKTVDINPPPQAHLSQKSPVQNDKPPKSPVVAIKSISPRYNPKLPLHKQEYYPQSAGSNNFPRPASPRSADKPVHPADVDAVLGPKTVPASVLNFPADALAVEEVRYSSAEELLSLWESANGQQLQGLGTFNLRMERINAATFTFGDPQHPFYTLHTYSTNELSLMRNHPLKPNRSVQVMMLKLENPARRQPPHDGLVTVIFSKLAAMLAVEQAAELRRLHHLAPTEAVEVETNAVERAAAQELCRLIWNEQKSRYELQHPALLKQHAPSLVGEDGNPLSRVQTKKPGTLHITVSKRPGTQPPSVVVTSPVAPNAVEGADWAATPRTSTLPLTDNDEPLASLDLGSMCLSICAGLTTTIIPSLYAIDSLVAAILAVAVSDEATNPVLANKEIYTSSHVHIPPRETVRRSKIRNSLAATSAQTRRFTGKLIATFAEREDAEEEAKLMAQLRSSSDKKKSSQSKSKSTKQIVIDEIDLEKYGRYGSGSSRAGQELPGPTRLILRLMVWLLEVVVRVLTAGVKCLAWMLVNVTRCVTSERF